MWPWTQLNRIESKLDALLKGQRTMAATLDQCLADVTAESTAIGSLSTLMASLQQQIAAQGLSAADQAKVDAIFAGAEANKTALAAALAANVPPAPPVPSP